jgi:hypothetical protein
MMSKSGPTRSGTPQAQPIIIIAITLFAFSGIMVGFTVGAFARFARPPATDQNQTNITNHTTPTPTPTPSPTNPVVIHLGPPELTAPNPTNRNGTLVYSESIRAKDKAGSTKPVTADGITCRIWLVPGEANVTDDLNHNLDQLRHPETFNQPFPREVPNALVFEPSTLSETQPCVQGSAQWKFTISPSVSKGDYSLVGLTDWQGKSYNWTWWKLTVADGKK